MNFSQWFFESSREDVAKSYDRHGFASSMPLTCVADFVTKHLKINPHAEVLDFGAGKTPLLSIYFKKLGYNIDSHELPQNRSDMHDDVKNKKYDLVLASGVLNIQKSIKNLKKTILEIDRFMKRDGSLLATVPDSPSENNFPFKKIKKHLSKFFDKMICIRVKGGMLLQAFKNHEQT